MGIKFKYLLDPLFLFSLALYSINKSPFLKFGFLSCNFFTYYFNDLLLVPVLVPIILFCSKAFKLRNVYSPPMFLEIIVPVAIWSIAFELIGPFYFGKGTSDPLDVFVYCLGGLIGWLIWNQGNLLDYLVNMKYVRLKHRANRLSKF